ncbi:uncharacterized protein LOC131437725 [Malaya genurostris]|uniref:uncharacterized protein LOC131437725 n=1 Tax=Malaya genurostris TaxID=325434 RepID=UPI0026F37E7A|nr:uncharacterized protein LOC131437725 [Malaya genurostris]
MNCSCTAQKCPHLEYIRALLETTDTCQAEELTPECGRSFYWQRLRKIVCYAVTALEIVIYFWLTMTKAALLFWLRLLDSNSYYWVGFLVFASALISSLPGVRGSMSLEVGPSAVDGTVAEKSLSTALIVIR